MVANSYYFVTASLPLLEMEAPNELSFSDFDTLLQLNLSEPHYLQFEVIRRYCDLQNLRLIWQEKKEEWWKWATLSDQQLEESLLLQEGLGDYVYAFIERYPDRQERVKAFEELVADYFWYESEQQMGFLKEYFRFEWEWRVVMIGLRSKQGEGERNNLPSPHCEDPLMKEVIEQGKDYCPPKEYEELEAICQRSAVDPIGGHRELERYRFEKIEQMSQGELFSIRRVLSYAVELLLVEQWLAQDKKQGLDLIDTIVKGVR